MHELSIIIPTLNEAGNIERLIRQLSNQENVQVEIIVADGGSTDATKEIVEGSPAQFIETASGRGKQLNAGAKLASKEFLLFLHADSYFTSKQQLANALVEIKKYPNNDVAGHFPLRFFDTGSSKGWSFRYMEAKTHLNRKNTTNGDQGLLLHREFFQRLNGYSDKLHFLEDQDIAERIRREGDWITLPDPLGTSARRFRKQGVNRTKIVMSIIMGLYDAGILNLYLHHTPKTYSEQKDTNTIRLNAYLMAIWKMLILDLGFYNSVRAWIRVGRYIRSNSWQMFFAVDVTIHPLIGPHNPFLRFHDLVFWPLTNWRLCDFITALLAFTWFMIVLPILALMLESVRSFRRAIVDNSVS